MKSQLIVRIARPRSGLIESRVFTDSPISIGSGQDSLLRLEAPSVSPRHGQISFTSCSIEYKNLTAGTAIVDGSPLQPGASAELRESSVIWIGPYGLCAEIEGRHMMSSEGVDEVARLIQSALGGAGVARTIITSTADGNRGPQDMMASLVGRALQLADVVAEVIIHLRAGLGSQETRRFDTSILRTSWNAHELAEWLLDPQGSDTRLIELKWSLLRLAQSAPLEARLVGRA